MCNDKRLYKIIEAVLFSFGEAISLDTLKSTICEDEQQILAAIKELEAYYEKNDSPLTVIKLEDSYQLCVKKDYYEYLVKVIKRPKKVKLTDAMLETLSIVAYKQPVTKADIENIRGVSADYAINKLIELGLIYESGRLDAIGKPMLFSTTNEFLRRFGISSKSLLPVVDDASQLEIIKDVEYIANEELGFDNQS